MKTKLLTALLITAAAVVAPWRSAEAAIIGFETLVDGGDLVVTVVVSDLNNDVVAAYDMDIAFNTSALAFSSVTFGSLLGGGIDSLQASGALGGIVDVAEASFLTDDELFALQGGNTVNLFAIRFDIVEMGEYDLAFIWDELNDVKGRRNQVIIPGREVPEPATLGLLGLGLAGLGLARRRRTV